MWELSYLFIEDDLTVLFPTVYNRCPLYKVLLPHLIESEVPVCCRGRRSVYSDSSIPRGSKGFIGTHANLVNCLVGSKMTLPSPKVISTACFTLWWNPQADIETELTEHVSVYFIKAVWIHVCWVESMLKPTQMTPHSPDTDQNYEHKLHVGNLCRDVFYTKFKWR